MSKEFKPHKFNGVAVGRVYCVKCGLLALKNEATREAIRQGCDE